VGGLPSVSAPQQTRDEPNQPRVRVRRLHHWVTYLRFPLTPAQAQQLASGDDGVLRARSPLDVSILPPVCEVCEIEWAAAQESCPGDPRSQLT
jgi:hypothetical protein